MYVYIYMYIHIYWRREAESLALLQRRLCAPPPSHPHSVTTPPTLSHRPTAGSHMSGTAAAPPHGARPPTPAAPFRIGRPPRSRGRRPPCYEKAGPPYSFLSPPRLEPPFFRAPPEALLA